MILVRVLDDFDDTLNLVAVRVYMIAMLLDGDMMGEAGMKRSAS